MKKILFIFLIILFIFFIYFFTKDDKEYIFIFGDKVCQNNTYTNQIKKVKGNKIEKYINICQKEAKIRNYIDKIENNAKIKYQNNTYTMNNLLIKADTIIISIGIDELLSYDQNSNMYVYIDEVLLDVEKLLELVRYYSKEQVYIYNYYGLKDKYLNYLNRRLNNIANTHDINIIDISSISNTKLDNRDYEIITNNTLLSVVNDKKK